MATADDPSALVSQFFNSIFTYLSTGVRNFKTNFYNSFADVSAQRWIRIAVVVAGYLLIRPYIDAFFKWTHDRERKKRQAEKEKEEEAFGVGASGDRRKVKKSANALRGGGGGTGENDGGDGTEGEGEGEGVDGESDFAKASGVPEWGKNARKRQKKYLKALEKGKEAGKSAENLSEEQLLELLDWSESEGDGPTLTKKDE